MKLHEVDLCGQHLHLCLNGQALFDLYDEYRHVRNALSQQGVLTYCPYVFSFE